MRMRQHIAFQRIESAVIFIASTYIYFDSGFSVVAYVLLLFAFDVSMVGYLKNAKVGAFVYNLAHSLTLPLMVLVASWVAASDAAMAASPK
jgi:hypothetical protein